MKTFPCPSNGRRGAGNPSGVSLCRRGEDWAAGMGKPMAGIGLEYMLKGKADMPVMEGVAGIGMGMPMVTVTLPVHGKRPESPVNRQG